VYNLNNNVGFVNVGTSHDTSEFAVESISRWWATVGKHTHTLAVRKSILHAILAEVIVVGRECGNISYSNSQVAQNWRLKSHTSLEEHQNGIKLSIICFVISQKIGRANLSWMFKLL